MEKIALITGAGRGIGRATAVELSRRGYRCALIARSAEQLKETASQCAEKTLCLPLDVQDTAALTAAIERAGRDLGPITALVNNAGHAPLLPFEQTTEAIFRRTIDTNLTATFVATRAVWDGMVARKDGVIVNVSSESARDPFTGFSAYAAAKAGVNLFTRALAKEGAAHNVRVHAVAPAGVDTAMLRAIVPDEAVKPEDLLVPDDVAGVIADCITGSLWCTSGETIYVHRKG